MVTGLKGASYEPEQWDREDVTTAEMARFVSSSSKGLAELTKENYPRVQFIHESVRDYLLKDGGLRESWPGLHGELSAPAHDRLESSCLHYNSSKAVRRLRDEPQPDDECTDDKFPFLRYATTDIFHHAEVAQSGGIAQDGFLKEFPLDHWMSLHNSFQEHDSWKYGNAVTSKYTSRALSAWGEPRGKATSTADAHGHPKPTRRLREPLALMMPHPTSHHAAAARRTSAPPIAPNKQSGAEDNSTC
ncbi:hypothetical protein EJ03DRAFT_334621 [Teratosphaeria nubilosa]|uniref:Uncharacterized protein n=1 Tax=Teratosphaeria nubilosa TaxID=161662 RepID=A0A6G1LFF9_9PEZI|nr:hypothetical protein EJ03DRAFT_334621 [Teratosphaeria nubilosa]